MADPAVGDMDANGRLVGVDGVLDQVGEALRKQAEPLLRDTVLPLVQNDPELQRRIGAAAGDAAARRLEPWIAVGAVLLGALTVTAIVREVRHQRRRGRRRR